MPPTGQSAPLTVLFTDIEGSTRLWEAHDGAMRRAHDQHDRILLDAFESHGGTVVKNRGDGFMVVFTDPVDAMEAAVTGQLRLHEAEWPQEIGLLRVRAALSTGVVEERDGDFYGTPVNRGARLEGVAHGGQVLVSDSTRALIVDRLPPDRVLVDLGRHRLRGLTRDERIFQVSAPGLPDTFPPLRTAAARGRRLPSFGTTLVGRDGAVDEVRRLLDGGARLVTLLGPGGVGKTRLGVEVAARLEPDLAGGVFFADLASVESPDGVTPALVEAVGAHSEGVADPVDIIAEVIDGAALLVMDGFGRLGAAKAAVADVLDRCPDLRILATGHAPIGIGAERIFRVPPLDVEGGGERSPAATLFYERAADQGVALTDADLAAVDSIARRLDGLPLAIELVAARTRLLSVAELDRILEQSLDAFAPAIADDAEGRRTIRGAIDWSLQGLSSAQRSLFMRLSALPAGATLDMATRVCGDGGPVLDDLAALVDTSLVNAVTGLPGGTRFRQLAPLREYGAELLERKRATGSTLDRLVDYYVAESPRLRRSLATGADAEYEMKVDHPNLAKAMDRSIDAARVEEMAEVLMNLWIYWFNGDRFAGLAEWLRRIDPLPESARLQWLDGFVAFQQGDFERAATRLRASWQAFREAGHRRGEALAATFLAPTVEDPGEARVLLGAAKDHFTGPNETSDEPIGEILVPLFESLIDALEGDHEASLQERLRGLAIAERLDYGVIVAWLHWNLSTTYVALGRFREATTALEASLDYMAADAYQEGVASCALVLGVLEIEMGRPESGARLIAGAQAIFHRIGAVAWIEAMRLADAAAESARQSLGDADYTHIWAEAETLSLGEVVELATTAIAAQSADAS